MTEGLRKKIPFWGMAWAVDRRTRSAVYVGSLRAEQTGLRCECECPACDAILQAVGAGNRADDGQRAPFFRHHKSTQGPGCKYRVAELAALKLLVERGLIDIPAPSRRAPFVGRSGDVYIGEAVGVAVHERIIAQRLVSSAHAVLTLESGRTVVVVLRGHQDIGELGSVFAVIEVKVDDPEVALLSPDEILARAELTDQWIDVKHHRDHERLTREAQDLARQQAIERLDVDPEELGLPVGATKKQASESLRHWAVKDALLKVGTLHVPACSWFASAVDDAGQPHTVEYGLPAMDLILTDVFDEVLFDGYRPDIHCVATDRNAEGQRFRLMVEVAWKHHVDVEKLGLIQRDQLACIELDVGKFTNGGQVERSKLPNLVRDDVNCKQWLHHPRLEQLRENAQRTADEAVQAANQLFAARAEEQRTRKSEGERLRREDEIARAQAERREQEIAERDRRRRVLRRNWASQLSRAQSLEELRLVLERRWLGELEITSNGMNWPSFEFEREIAPRLAGGRLSAFITERGGIAWRLATIERAAAEGAPVDFDAVAENSQFFLGWNRESWRGLIHLVIDLLACRVEPEQFERYSADRDRVLRSLQAGEWTYARETSLDEVLRCMFPALGPALGNELSTEAYAKRVDRERAIAQEVAKAEAKREADELAAREAEEQRRRLLLDALEAFAYQMIWNPNLSTPQSAEQGVEFLKVVGLVDLNVWVTALVRRAWSARRDGYDFGVWIKSVDFASLDQLELSKRALEGAFMIRHKVSAQTSAARPRVKR